MVCLCVFDVKVCSETLVCQPDMTEREIRIYVFARSTRTAVV